MVALFCPALPYDRVNKLSLFQTAPSPNTSFVNIFKNVASQALEIPLQSQLAAKDNHQLIDNTLQNHCVSVYSYSINKEQTSATSIIIILAFTI